ncbi:MAG: hypothetical protein E7773_13150 [Sphingomonas sp.]|uniref:hypothetical protein n=1 Tax=Sphingomonas sp. TaxID=28214 RepID=UPI0011FAD324|nr:hypothetical protein [Sphingomonas sp.]THD35379.1 MAG: hypothetical protein E7773_13150 [Sphingomonas sp.]
MMRNVSISIDVFHAIWAAREQGENDEDAILRRLLKVAGGASIPAQGILQQGRSWTDKRYGVEFPHGFEIYRRYLGRDFRAVVMDGRWTLNGREIDVKSINELSQAAGTKTENGWVNWRYRSADGTERKIAELRN